MNFENEKKNMLKKKDKSTAGEIDVKIRKLVEQINNLNDYYTTSSCSGRIKLIYESATKEAGLFVKVWHEKIKFSELKNQLIKLVADKERKLVYFKQEPCILHVACRDFDSAVLMLTMAQEAGWKRSGIIASGKRFVVELISTEKLELPIMKDGKILVGDGYLKILIREGNYRLERSWVKIQNLRGVIK